LHVAAVFVNNFTNHLYQIGNEICDENQIPFSILHFNHRNSPEIMNLPPALAQTGPIRNDEKTIERNKHLYLMKIN
jgi:hypothetical protein